MKAFLLVGLALAAILLFSGCVQDAGQGKTGAELASDKCVQLCSTEVEKGTDLSNGPCLSNGLIDDWVCDVAHVPRADVDNNPANQCSEFGKTARHFVEVDEDCGVIRTY